MVPTAIKAIDLATATVDANAIKLNRQRWILGYVKCQTAARRARAGAMFNDERIVRPRSSHD